MRRNPSDPAGQYEGDYMNFCAEEWPEYSFSDTKNREIPQIVISDIMERVRVGNDTYHKPLTEESFETAEQWIKESKEELIDFLFYFYGVMAKMEKIIALKK